MTWTDYWAVLVRRWWIVAGILLLTAAASGYLYRKSSHAAGFQGCLTLYVADVSSPSLIAAPSTTLQNAGQLLAGETAANFFADDILDVAQSSRVATFVSAQLQPKHLADTTPADINGHVSGARKDRTVNLCVTNPDSASALAAANTLGVAMTVDRSKFVGQNMARRTFVSVVSAAGVTPAPTSNARLNLALRLFLGLLVALGVAFLWDALDPMVRDGRDVEQAVGAPLLARL